MADRQSTGNQYRVVTDRLVAEGTPHAWGGGNQDGPSAGLSDGGGRADAHADSNKVGFDAGSLAQYLAFQAAGVELPRTVGAQWDAVSGNEVAATDLAPGDLMFPAGQEQMNVYTYLGEGLVASAGTSGGFLAIIPTPQGAATITRPRR